MSLAALFILKTKRAIRFESNPMREACFSFQFCDVTKLADY
jgi:hypothetical protein